MDTNISQWCEWTYTNVNRHILHTMDICFIQWTYPYIDVLSVVVKK